MNSWIQVNNPNTKAQRRKISLGIWWPGVQAALFLRRDSRHPKFGAALSSLCGINRSARGIQAQQFLIIRSNFFLVGYQCESMCD